MEGHQAFRVAGTTTVRNINIDHIDGQNIIYWEDIEQAFPGVQHVQNGEFVVKLLRDHNRIRIVPHCIKHCQGVILDVVLPTVVINGHADFTVASPSQALASSADAPTQDKVFEALQVGPQPAGTPFSDTNVSIFSTMTLPLSSNSTLEVKAIPKAASKKAQEFEVEQRLLSLMSPELQVQARASSNAFASFVQATKNAQVEQFDRLSREFKACFQELKTEMTKNAELTSRMVELQEAFDVKQEEMKQLQIQALDQYAKLQTRVQTVLTQTFELHEYPIPRLFVVLPQDSSPLDFLDPFRNKFRLYFLCECGEHTKLANSKSKIPHHIHLAKHDGYDIARPSEFFQKYGPYALTILKMLKLGISVAGVAVPAISHLISTDVIDQATIGLQQLKNNIEPGMDQVIGYFEEISQDGGEAVKGGAEQMENNETLEGADLRKLHTFLKDKDGSKVLGNLYRTVTVKGHVKWVCIDHYRENYQVAAAEAFRRALNSVGGSFDENVGRVEVELWSRVLADQFYKALEKAKYVHELKIRLSWETTYSDLRRLRNTLRRTSIAVLELECDDSPTSDILIRGRRCDPIFQIMRQASIQSFELTYGSSDFFQRSSPLPSDADLSNLRHLKISRSEYGRGLPNVNFIKHKLDMAKITLGLDPVRLADLTDADIAKLKLLVAKAPNLLSLSFETSLEQLPKVFSSIAEHQTYPIDFKNLLLRFLPPKSKACPSTAAFQDLAHLFQVYGMQLEALGIGRFEITDLEMEALAEATSNGSSLKDFYWGFVQDVDIDHRHIKNLAAILAKSKLRKMWIDPRKVEAFACVLDSIQWEHIHELTVTVDSFVELRRTVSLDRALDQVIRIIGQEYEVDFSHLQYFCLQAEQWDSSKVQSILDALQDATELRTIVLRGANIMEEHQEQAYAKGLVLVDHYR
ncbi:hypothetical protein EDD21DRAFT_216054 [Dissophora ornata]|nr:hypothetical protein EDD21DRAFT_216054 [Dissophora ornata]